MSLTKNQILAVPDVEVKAFDIPEWGGEVYFREMSGAQLDEYDASISEDAKGRKNYELMALLIRMTACDGNGVPLFDKGDEVQLATKNGPVLRRVFNQIKHFVGERDDPSKNSKGDPSDDSGSDSPG